MQPACLDVGKNVLQVLKDVFGYNSFLPNQQEIVSAILDHSDTFVVMPTGGGKSLGYQLPAHILDGTCIVISPLISLMKDQVDAAVATGLRASFLNSSLSVTTMRQVETHLLSGQLDLIYVSPERFGMPEFIELLEQISLSFVAIDEAHCISEWGHDFRPDYLNLASIVHQFPDVPVTAFTATATHRVQDDIVKRLGLRNPHMVRASFNRPNLYYRVIPKQRPADQILKFIRTHAGEPGIVYRTTRKSVETTADMLTKNGIKSLPYHAGLSDSERAKNQDAFNRDEIDVIVATIAFGMGIDKSNVRYVLHGDLPKSSESYYQETGRSGRDGEPAECLLLFGYGDIPKIRFFIDQMTDDTEKKHALRCLNSMINYATVYACRRKTLLKYFGEEYSGPLAPEGQGSRVRGQHMSAPSPSPRCCDICAGEVEKVDATRDAQILMSAIARTDERFGISHIVDVVTGAGSERIRQLRHDQIKTYGIGKDRDKRHWRLLIDNLLAQGLIIQTAGDYPVLKLQPESRSVLFGSEEVTVLKTIALKSKPARTTATDEPYDEVLFDQLRALRKRLASEQGVPPYVVFTDRTLHEMARQYPSTESEMLQITGVGETKFTRYGSIFIELIVAHAPTNSSSTL
jgi:ATP-dependent DNA helicase RecQ